jgi:hypothetical protein
MLDQSRADQVEATNLKTHEDYQKAVEKRAGWVQFGAAAGIAAGVAFLPATAAVGTAAVLVPLATDIGSGALEQVVGQVVGGISENSVDEHKEKVDDLTSEEFLQRHGVASDDDFAEDMEQAMLIGYGEGNDRENQQGNDPETG